MVAPDKIALALSDPIRLQILDVLAGGRHDACCSPENPEAPVAMCSCDLLSALGLAPSRLSYHIKELREAGLVTEQKSGRWVYFTLNRGALFDFTKALLDRYSVPSDTCCSSPLIQVDTSAEQ